MLYQLSYTGSRVSGGRGREVHAAAGHANGATPQNRTGDTVIFSHVLYQLS